jgi:hypothetical protein
MKVASLALVVTALVLSASAASAFERQWHVGAGLGVANPTHPGVGAGPAVNLYGAYGLTDMFDLKLDLMASQHPLKGSDERYRTIMGTLGLSYKIDIIEWIPYFGLSGGVFRTDLPESVVTEEQDIALGGFLGLDYAVSRSFGLGVVSRAHWFVEGEGMGEVYFRAEYRWGW